MTLLVGALLTAATGAVLLECAARMHRVRLAPWRLRMLYASYLLNDGAIQSLIEIHQRVERAGVRSFDELFALYASAAGKSPEEIHAAFGLSMPWRQLFGASLSLRTHLQWHTGLVPVPDQRTRTATIDADGTRKTGERPRAPSPPDVKRVVVLGGSVAWGYGATADEATMPARLEHHLNRLERRSTVRWEVANYAFPGATSFQELITALQRIDPVAPPDYIVSLSGCNDVDQQFGQMVPNVSALTQSYTDALQRGTPLSRFVKALLGRSAALHAVSRFATAYRSCHLRNSAGAQGEVDWPSMYPLW